MAKINASIDFDKKLYAQDIAGSKAHANMLARQRIISRADASAITRGLDQIREEIEAGRFNFNAELEDIHLNIESRLKEIAGEPAGRLHTARSRNDQVATDFRLYVREAVDHFIDAIRDLMLALAEKAEANAGTLMPGFTHLQSAQPITFGHHLLAYVEMLSRDLGRFTDARKRLNESPLGSAALAGTSYPIDRKATAYALGFDHPMRNSVDGVSARDFALEVLSACAICSIHLSRLAEEIVIWSSAQFRFIKLSDKFTTGSSIMPQKRNPDAAELIRAKPGRIMGAFNALAIMMKGLPLAYAKDMQEDKEQTFDALENFELAVAAMAGMVRDMEPNKEAMLAAANSGFSTATDLADWLVQKLKMPFREAHHVTGRIVALADEKGVLLQDLALADMRTVHPKIDEGVFRVLSVQASVSSRTSQGGTAPANVLGEAKAWIKQLRGRRK